jgi:hypothetical protein
MKTMEEYFRDWEDDAFGFGYGTGEEHIIPAIKTFFELLTKSPRCDIFGYSYLVLEQKLGPAVTWLLINRLCQVGVIEYGTSPRNGWLSPNGMRLKEYISSKSFDDLYQICTSIDEFTILCYPFVCNCDQKDGARCRNPFWRS